MKKQRTLKSLRALKLGLLLSASLPLPAAAGLENGRPVRGFHLDLRVQVMTLPALKALATRLSQLGINTLVMEWEASFPFIKHPVIPNRYAYAPAEVKEFIRFCGGLGIDVIPLQQCFGHVEYILRHQHYAAQREDPKEISQVCPLEAKPNQALFRDLFTELVASHPSPYIHLGGDETYLLGHCQRCQTRVKEVGVSRLYVDHLAAMAKIAISLGKRPILWADIALKHPQALEHLPKQCILVDWNYGWELDRFGDHQKLMQSGFEIWGSPALRSHPDDQFLIMWEKHLKNIRDFIPSSRKLGYQGLVLTSWSTSGAYSTVFGSHNEILDLIPIRRVYPLAGCNLLLTAYAESLKSDAPLDIPAFVSRYGMESYGFSKAQASLWWKALSQDPYEVQHGKVLSPKPMPLSTLRRRAEAAAKTLAKLRPLKNEAEFEHYRLLADIRAQYLSIQDIERQANEPSVKPARLKALAAELGGLLTEAKALDQRFIAVHEGNYFRPELDEENEWRVAKAKLLYERLGKLR